MFIQDFPIVISNLHKVQIFTVTIEVLQKQMREKKMNISKIRINANEFDSIFL